MQRLHPVHACYDGVFNSATGLIIDINNPTLEMFCIEDIASALSKICRFGGHCREFYSVAQHSVFVARLARGGLKLEALMHDAAEAYLGDVIKPLKVILGSAYADIESRFMNCIISRYGLDAERLVGVKPYDRNALSHEHEWLQQGKQDEWRMLMNSLALPTRALCPVEAEDLFLNEYRSVMSLIMGAAAVA